MVLGMLFENFKNVPILRYVNYEFLKKVLGGPQPTCLVRVFCEVSDGLKAPILPTVNETTLRTTTKSKSIKLY